VDAVTRLNAALAGRYASSASFLENLKPAPAFQALVAEVRPRWERAVSWESAGS
jgi:hypothetical protein